jgi:hypothetical protein
MGTKPLSAGDPLRATEGCITTATKISTSMATISAWHGNTTAFFGTWTAAKLEYVAFGAPSVLQIRHLFTASPHLYLAIQRLLNKAELACSAMAVHWAFESYIWMIELDLICCMVIGPLVFSWFFIECLVKLLGSSLTCLITGLGSPTHKRYWLCVSFLLLLLE